MPLELLFSLLVGSFLMGLALGCLAAVRRVDEFEQIICLAILLLVELRLLASALFAILLPPAGLVIFGALVGCAVTRILAPRARV